MGKRHPQKLWKFPPFCTENVGSPLDKASTSQYDGAHPRPQAILFTIFTIFTLQCNISLFSILSRPGPHKQFRQWAPIRLGTLHSSAWFHLQRKLQFHDPVPKFVRLPLKLSSEGRATYKFRGYWDRISPKSLTNSGNFLNGKEDFPKKFN